MTYKQEITEYKGKALEVFKGHLEELENNVIKANENVEESSSVSDVYTNYQESTLKLIEGKIKIDNEFLKQINITYLDKYKDLKPEQFQEIQEKIVSNHQRIITELKTEYEQFAKDSRENLKYKLAEAREDNDLKINNNNPDEFFSEKMNILSANFIIIFVLLVIVVGLIYYYIFM